ncbi:family 20 glycosylhydrolase [Gryllotalpicola protaetiae]|uniref:family 20 glycosylhydrolase n=1 Tax=Gryllotalpicola protaetiae TaxID=2419771 RepID=UPI0013C45C1E|nr:family 20 glycosylhydrolase [Gryllotalpicola protaetiae]
MSTADLIPRPLQITESTRAFELGRGAALRVTAPCLEETGATFVSSLRAWCGIDITRGDAVDSTNVIELQLVDAIPGEERLPAVRGVRADGADVERERYRLEVTLERILVRATHPEGIHRGLTTLTQLAATGPATGSIACTTILDAPRFAWRGLSLDVARHFLDVDRVLQVIDLLDLYKFNTLHLHLTDDQGWRLAIPTRPALTAAGPHYSAAEYQRIVDHAAARFITVVPEIDLPGHSAAAIAAYPEIGADAAQDDSGQRRAALDGSREETWRFVDDVICAVADLTPGRYVHIGGDEAFDLTPSEHARFVTRAAQLVAGTGKYVVGWQEAARGALPAESIVQYWIQPELLDALARSGALPETVLGLAVDDLIVHYAPARDDLDLASRQGAWVVASPVSATYLDRRYAAPSSDPAQGELRARLGNPLYPPASLDEYAAWNPDDLAPGFDASRLAGIEAALWAETVRSDADMLALLLPRLPLIAEHAWGTTATSWERLRSALARHAAAWRSRGLHWFASDEVDWEV